MKHFLWVILSITLLTSLTVLAHDNEAWNIILINASQNPVTVQGGATLDPFGLGKHTLHANSTKKLSYDGGGLTGGVLNVVWISGSHQIKCGINLPNSFDNQTFQFTLEADSKTCVATELSLKK